MNDIRDDYLKFKVDDDTVGRGGGIFSTIIKILAIILLLLLLVVLGALAYKFLFKDEAQQSVQTNIQPIQQPQPSKQQQVVSAVTSQVDQGGVKKEEIALIVKSVLEQMNKEKSVQKTQVQSTQNSNTPTQQPTTNNQQDNGDAALLNDLSAAKVDNVEEDDIDLSALDSVNSKKQIKNNSKKADTFNKVIINKNEVATKDDLSKLYEKLNQIMKKDKTKVKNSQYVSNLKKETKVRSNAMRIITVRRGDTLSKIAARAYGDAMMYPKIYAANPDLIKDPNLIHIGQKLRVPK